MNGPITTAETYHISNIIKHYAHVKEKHPYFCDWVMPDTTSEYDRKRVESGLKYTRKRLADATKRGTRGWDDILDCKMWEVFDALVRGDRAQAVEELYDCIAILLRVIDVLEGRQKLGKPEEA